MSAFVPALVGAGPAFANGPWWQTGIEAAPTYLPPGGEVELVAGVTNMGDEAVSGSEAPVTITDRLPAGLVPISVAGQPLKEGGRGAEVTCPTGALSASISCTLVKGTVNPYERLKITIRAKVEEPAGTATSLPNEIIVEGGLAPRVASTQQLTVSGEPVPFGIRSYELTPLNEDGTPATEAGAQPFQLTTALTTNEDVQIGSRQPVALPRDLSINLPPGLVGNPNAVAQCSEADFAAVIEEANLCPATSVVGVATVVAYEPLTHIIPKTVPVFNLVPAEGEPARFGFEVIGRLPIVIDTSVRTGKDYGVVATVHDATQTAGLLSSQVTLWGDPGDPAHNNSRGWECIAGGTFQKQIGKPCPATSAEPDRPFLTLPTSCAADPATEPVLSSIETDSWAEPGRYLGDEYVWMSSDGRALGFEGCAQLPFDPEILVNPEQRTAATPTGAEVKVEVPQQSTLEVGGLAEADLRNTTVTLPEGMELSPSAANGLEACSESQIGYEGFNEKTQTDEFSSEKPSCPEASKVGTVKIKTPLLSHELEGSLYLATPAPNGASEPGQNPFNSLVALYLVAEDPISGVLVKLVGEGTLSESTLELSTSFENAPQVPFEELTLNLFGGPRASLSTPARCGAFSAQAAFTPWSGAQTLQLASPPFEISSGAEDLSCPGASLPFDPSVSAGSASSKAGAFTEFNLEVTRPDADQALKGLTLHLPEGIAALLSKVTLCSEAAADANSCPPESQIGSATAVAGLGPDPFIQEGGKVFITGPYDGAPFGLQILTPAVAGPFNLDFVSVRSKLRIDPTTAAVNIETPSLPTQIRGIPLQLKRVIVQVNRPEFEFNPTSCAQKSIDGTVTGSEGAGHNVQSSFQAQACAALPFSPGFSASATGHGSKADGTTFKVTVTSSGVNGNGVAQAGIAKVDLQLPKQLSSRLPTLQKACTEAAFDVNPASCPEGSVIGAATIRTPVLKSALAGPAYLVSHGNAAFPDVEFVLQGEGIELVLDGKTQIKKGITYSKFESTPDAPFTVFETVLPAGPHGVLTPNVTEKKHFDLCGERLSMPTTMVGQNGAVIERDTRIAIEGCGAVESVKAHKLTNAQKRAKALAVCRKRYRHARHRRVACERAARRRYPAGKTAHEHKRASKSAGKR
ncbi:MAG TPA: hypothetical protein VMB51_08125 [Solirubrobacteraceae bacterium]|nr:hypothetical protein [Solirubrobacteraceae bacterium]